jgi:Cation transport ATPase
MAAASPLKLHIEGMDCASCALKIETAMQRLPGVSDVNVSYSSGTLALKLDEDRTSRRTVEDKIRTLGYQPAETTTEARPGLPARRLRQAWWQGTKARLVFMTGGLFVAAFVASLLLPQWDAWLFSAAALVSVVPFARRALAGALEGSPFTIETLMSVAALGAIAIGEAEEAAVVVFLFAHRRAPGNRRRGSRAGRHRSPDRPGSPHRPAARRTRRNGKRSGRGSSHRRHRRRAPWRQGSLGWRRRGRLVRGQRGAGDG